MIKAALFDMDGVLYDSMPNQSQAWHETMTSYGVKCRPEDFYMYEGRTGFKTINILFKQSFGRDATVEEQKEIYDKKCLRFIELEKTKPMPGVLDVLKKVGEQTRLEMEKFFDCKVFLETWVKVKKNWRDSESQVRNFGYTAE